MDTKRKFKITLTVEDGPETVIWTKKVTCEEMDQRFHDEIKAQLVIYNADHKYRQLCGYNEVGMKIAQETFHGR